MAEYGKFVNRGFRVAQKCGVTLLLIPRFERFGFNHCFTTRRGGVSPGVFSSLNLSRTREENEENKRENYGRVCAALGVPYESLTLVNYAHGDVVQAAAQSDMGKGISRESDFAPCDGMVTDAPGVTAATLHADCAPLFFADPKTGAAGVAHAGWKGVYLELAVRMAEAMEREYGSRRRDLLVGVGPHISVKRFEVKEDVAGPFAEKFGGGTVRERDGKLFVDLGLALTAQLEGAGIAPENVTYAGLCTWENPELFYSHRRDKGNTGAMGSFIQCECRI